MSQFTFSSSEIVEQTKESYDLVLEDVEPISIESEEEAKKSIQDIIQNVGFSIESDRQINTLNKGIQYLKGGVIEFQEYRKGLTDAFKSISDAAQNIHPDLLQSLCLYVTQLAREIGPSIDLVGNFIEALSPQLSSGIPSCVEISKYAINNIIINCPSRKVFEWISALCLEKLIAKRAFGAECLELIISSWPVNKLEPHWKNIDTLLCKLLHDSLPEARYSARNCISILKEINPIVAGTIAGKQDNHTLSLILKENGSPTAPRSPSSKKRYNMQFMPLPAEPMKYSPKKSDDDQVTVKAMGREPYEDSIIRYGYERYSNEFKVEFPNQEFNTITKLSSFSEIDTTQESQQIDGEIPETSLNDPSLSAFNEDANITECNLDFSRTTSLARTRKPHPPLHLSNEELFKWQIEETQKDLQHTHIEPSIDAFPSYQSPEPGFTFKRAPYMGRQESREIFLLTDAKPVETEVERKDVTLEELPFAKRSPTKKGLGPFDLQKFKEHDFLKAVEGEIDPQNNSHKILNENSEKIVSGVIECLKNNDPTVKTEATKIVKPLLDNIPNEVERHLQELESILIINSVSYIPECCELSQELLNELPKLFDPNTVLSICLQADSSPAVCSLLASTVAMDEVTLSKPRTVHRALTLAMKCAPIEGCRESAAGAIRNIASKNPKETQEFVSALRDSLVINLKDLVGDLPDIEFRHIPPTVPAFKEGQTRRWAREMIAAMEAASDEEWSEMAPRACIETNEGLMHCAAVAVQVADAIVSRVSPSEIQNETAETEKSSEKSNDLCEACLLMVPGLAKCRRGNFVSQVEAVLSKVEAANTPDAVAAAVASLAKSNDEDTARAGLALLEQMITRLTCPSDLNTPLKQAMASSAATVRRAAVKVYVAIYTKFGEEATKELTVGMKKAQQNLINTYCEKAKKD